MLDLGNGTTQLKFKGQVYELRLPSDNDYSKYRLSLDKAESEEEKTSLLYKFIEEQGLPQNVRKEIPLIHMEDIVNLLMGNGKS